MPKELWKVIRDLVTDDRIYHVDLGESVKDGHVKRCLGEDIMTITDFGLESSGYPLADGACVLDIDNINSEFADDISGETYWDRIRDIIHEERYSHKDTKVLAGQKTASLRRFIEDIEEGDIIMGKNGDVIVLGIVKSEARYDSESWHYELSSHPIYRSVKWSEIEILRENMPTGFGGGRKTVEYVSNPKPMLSVLRGMCWIADVSE